MLCCTLPNAQVWSNAVLCLLFSGIAVGSVVATAAIVALLVGIAILIVFIAMKHKVKKAKIMPSKVSMSKGSE